jgi:hypothetical protein
MMEAVRTSETSVDNYFIRHYIPEDNSEQPVCRLNKILSLVCFCTVHGMEVSYLVVQV